MRLLRNDQIARCIKHDINGQMRTAFIAVAALHGPYDRPRDWAGIALYAVYAAAAIFIVLDLFVWRAG